MTSYANELKDSGVRVSFDSGMVRDTSESKVDYTLVLDGPMFERWAAHMTKGAHKYEPRNWMKASGPEELERFRQSALRHFIQWFRGDTDEDHAAAVYFNLNGAEYVKAQPDMSGPTEEQLCAEDDLQYFRDRVAQLTAENDTLRAQRGMIHYRPFSVDL